MILKNIVIENFGPFSPSAEIVIDPEVTIFTGPNDSGKSLALKAILLSLYLAGNMEEHERYIERSHSSDRDWNDDAKVRTRCTFIVNDAFMDNYTAADLKPGDEISMMIGLAPKHRQKAIDSFHRPGNKEKPRISEVKAMPAFVWLPQKEPVHSELNFNSLNRVEKQLMEIGLGNNPNKIGSSSDSEIRRQLDEAARRINQRLQRILPPAMDLSLEFRFRARNPLRIDVFLRDSHGGTTPIHYRGSGVRSIVSLMVELVLLGDPRPTVILIDEPELSLHADAQHALRRFLEGLAAEPHIQVIYATHSPSMINNTRPHSIRVFGLKQRSARVGAVVDNNPIKDVNFQSVRTSLGMSPSDSLLYGPITIIVEGPTELMALPVLLRRLGNASSQGFEDILSLLSLSHIVSGGGATYKYWCQLLKSQGAQPIIFVDGGQRRVLEQQKVLEDHPEIHVIELPEGREFEDIIPRETYFEALIKVTAHDELTLDNFEEWERNNPDKNQWLFTAKIQRWLSEKQSPVQLSKPQVMFEAAQQVDLSILQQEKLRELVDEMRRLAEDLV